MLAVINSCFLRIWVFQTDLLFGVLALSWRILKRIFCVGQESHFTASRTKAHKPLDSLPHRLKEQKHTFMRRSHRTLSAASLDKPLRCDTHAYTLPWLEDGHPYFCFCLLDFEIEIGS